MSSSRDLQLAQFDRTTSLWGPVTMGLGLIVSLFGPAYLVFFTDLNVPLETIFAAFLAVAATFGIIWLTEPITYYPMLGPASMYQAFMIGNIANKLLPAAITAQETLEVERGSKKAEIVSAVAICGAALVHLSTLLVLVGVFGQWLISLVPPELLTIVTDTTLPAIMGAMCVQAVLGAPERRPALVALLVAAVFTLFLLPQLIGLHSVFKLLGTPVSVILACLASWFLRKK